MNKSTMELVDLRKDVCEVLVDVGESLIRDPEHLRSLKLFAERLDDVARQTADLDMMFLNSYLSLFVEDMFFNLLTDVSSLVKPEDRDKLIKDLGKDLKDLAQAIINKNNKEIYEKYKQIGQIWTKDMPNLGKRSENELRPQYPVRLEDTTLPLAAIRFNEYPATKHCENYLASGFRSEFHKDLDFITIDANLAKKDNIANYYVDKINEIKKGMTIDKLAFFDKAYGPIGAIALANSIISKTGIDAVYVRLRRRLNFDQIKGDLNSGDTVILISDVLTTGDGILKAVDIIKKNHEDVKVLYAVVFYDRMQGGRESLKRRGIELRTIFTRERFGRDNVEDVKDKYLFSWDSVPGCDNKKLIKFLRDDFDIDWAENSEIRKSKDCQTICISKDENSAEIKIDGKMKKAILKISDGRTDDLKVKTENGKLNIYKDKEIQSIPLTDEIVPLTKEEEKGLVDVFGKETVEIMKEGVITL
jgi:orotate phosphoribosyltransferase